jgi:hypothetical protein
MFAMCLPFWIVAINILWASKSVFHPYVEVGATRLTLLLMNSCVMISGVTEPM